MNRFEITIGSKTYKAIPIEEKFESYEKANEFFETHFKDLKIIIHISEIDSNGDTIHVWDMTPELSD